MKNAESDTSEKKLPDPFGIIERAGDLPLVMQVLAFALYLETLLLVFKRKNLLTFAWKDVDWSAEVGELLAAGLVYALILSVLLPLLESLMTAIFRWYLLRRLFDTDGERWAGRRPAGCVRDDELKHKADAEQSTYLLEMVREASSRSKDAVRQTQHLGTGALRVMVMLGANLYYGAGAANSIILDARDRSGSDRFDLVLALVFIALFLLCVRSWRIDPYRTVWIYYPRLHKELTAAR
jgi:hypothetical protein